MLAHRLDVAHDVSADVAWSWHRTAQIWLQSRGEAVLDLRNGAFSEAWLQTMVGWTSQTVDLWDDGAGGTCQWTPSAGLLIFDDLDAIESAGMTAIIAGIAAPGNFWDLIVSPGPCSLDDSYHRVGIVIWSMSLVPEAVVGQPWAATLVFENWRYHFTPGSVNWTCPPGDDGDLGNGDAGCRQGPCSCTWMYSGNADDEQFTCPVYIGYLCIQNFVTVTDGAGVAHLAIRLHGIPDRAGYWSVKISSPCGED